MYYQRFADEDCGPRFGLFGRHFPHGRFGFAQARRGDMRPIILGVLLKGPMHGYEIMTTLEDKSHGMWRPSPGSVYPTLQLLEEQDLVVGQEKDGKKVYSLTKKGQEEAEGHKTKGPWEDMGHLKDRLALRTLIFESMVVLKQIASDGAEEDLAEVKTILTETKDKLSAILNKQSHPKVDQ